LHEFIAGGIATVRVLRERPGDDRIGALQLGPIRGDRRRRLVQVRPQQGGLIVPDEWRDAGQAS